ncbi:MAG: hypothetical protein L6V93_12520 [Clostridiales bacterium]|nr:MAG: hypothetical protein L6V93_12520 [Clostridiales bacterium]
MKQFTDGAFARTLHRNFTSPSSDRAAPIACDAFNARTVAGQKYHCPDKESSPAKLPLAL